MALHQCGTCEKPLTLPPLQQNIVFTCCGNEKLVMHIFDTACLSKAVNASETPCPLCKAVIYPERLGKKANLIQDLFLEALKLDSEEVLSVLQTQEEPDKECSICLEDVPILPLRYDPTTKRLYHNTCSENTLPCISLQQLAKVTVLIVKKHSHLRPHFTPTPPVTLERLYSKNPETYQIVLSLGALSVGAFLFSYLNLGSAN